MDDDFQKLKLIRCGDAVTLRIPERWECNPHENVEGAWACYDAADVNETMTLWINVDYFRRPDEGGSPPDFNIREFLKKAASMEKEGTSHEDTLSQVELGYLRYRVNDHEEDGELLRSFHYGFFLGRDTESCSINFNLVVVHSAVDDPKILNLIKIIDRETRAAWLDPFADIERENAKKHFGPLATYNFDDQVKMLLPEATDCRYTGNPEDGEYLWHCSLDTEPTRVSMWVAAKDMDALLENGEPREFDAERDNIEEALAFLVSDKEDRVYLKVMPEGIFGYDKYDDTGAPTSEDSDAGVPLRNHRWGHLRYSGNSVRVVRVVLMLPHAQKDEPPLPDLVAYLHREVRRASFPSLDDAATDRPPD